MRLGRRGRSEGSHDDKPRILVPFTAGDLDAPVLEAAIRIALAEGAVIVPAYLMMVPREFAPEAPLKRQVGMAMPLLEAVELAASRAGILVDARIERGRTPTHALEKLWGVEPFDRIIVPAPTPGRAGFSPKELAWILTHAPSETLILRPSPTATVTQTTPGRGVNPRDPRRCPTLP